MSTAIYLLSDPRTDEPKYIGYSVNPTARMKQHAQGARNGAFSRSAKWWRELLHLGLEPVFSILELAKDGQQQHAERAWIRRFRDAGHSLLNGTDGGNGCPRAWNSGLTKHTDARVAGYAATMTGKPKSEEHKASLRQVDHSYAKGNKWGAENGGPHFAGHSHSLETRHRMSQIHKRIGSVERLQAVPYTAERRDKIRLASKRLAKNRKRNRGKFA